MTISEKNHKVFIKMFLSGLVKIMYNIQIQKINNKCLFILVNNFLIKCIQNYSGRWTFSSTVAKLQKLPEAPYLKITGT